MPFLSRKPEVKSRVIAVVGMHRSGTSCLAGSLQQKGLFLGEVHEWNEHNRKGNRENERIAELDDAVLHFSGGSWFEPPRKLKWTRKHERARDAIIADFESAGVPVWGFKEPRALLTMRFWQTALPQLELVGTFRHPYLVAKSLERRDTMPTAFAVKLWMSYNKAMLDLHAARPFPLISFDNDNQEYIRQIDALARKLALPNADSPEVFLDADLRNSLPETVHETIGPDAIALYDKLRALSHTL